MKTSDLLPIKILKGIGIAVVIFLSIFIYSFMGSKFGSNDDHDTPSAYGYDSLEAVTEPIMYVSIWQKNTHDFSDYPDMSANASFFYNITELPLVSGSSVYNTTDITYPNNPYDIIIQIDYDGNISGSYELPYSDSVYYMSTNNYAPAFGLRDSNEILNNNNGTFSGSNSVTLTIDDSCYYLYVDKLHHRHEELLDYREETANIKLSDYYTVQKITDVYDDVPESIEDFTRYVMTTHLTINAMHSTKPDVVVAEAILELKSYSKWIEHYDASVKQSEDFKTPDILTSSIPLSL